MRRLAPLLVIAALAAGCGGAVTQDAPNSGGNTLSGNGMSIELRPGWTGRIVLGASGKPVLHAASFRLPSNDTDAGQIAQETFGSPGGLYVNVRDLGPSMGGGGSLPVLLDRSDFGSPGPDDRCCFVTRASRSVTVGDHDYRITVFSGSDEPPARPTVAEANEILSTLSIAPYEPSPAEPAAGERLSRYGVTVALPGAWEGRIGRGILEAASEDGSLRLTLREHGAVDPAFVTGRLPIALGPAEFVPAEGTPGVETGRSFEVEGRQFVLTVRSQTSEPDPQQLAQANELLAGLEVEPGDFYPGRVEPAVFDASPGWTTGTTGSAEIEPDGEQTMSWASTVPYRDRGFQFPPHETLEALPRDGVLLVVILSRYGPPTGAPDRSPRFRLEDARDEGPFEGVPEKNATRVLRARVEAGYEATVWVFFGRKQPTAEQLERAQAELDRLRLPQWPPSETPTSGAP